MMPFVGTAVCGARMRIGFKDRLNEGRVGWVMLVIGDSNSRFAYPLSSSRLHLIKLR
jgi:hypothetical protein